MMERVERVEPTEPLLNEAGISEAIIDASTEAVAHEADAAIEVAQIEADRDVEIVEIQADAIQAREDADVARAVAFNHEGLEECRRRLETLEARISEAQSTLEALRLEQVNRQPPPAEENVEAMPVSPEAQEAPTSEPEPERPVRRRRRLI